MKHLLPNVRSLVFPLAVLASILIILVPLSPMVMDVLLAFNITLSVLILLTTIYIRTPLEFSVFPSVLLAVTLFRLGLNIATTRLILSHAQEQGTLAAGQVVNAFSNFVTNGNVVVGFVIFLIIVLIQFIVITKGATRISEVSARFILDGLPGKQMAIDADVQAGTITPDEAVRRRAELSDQVDFYGAMDGASKFVRGDAVAGICITIVNITGGMCIGLFSGKMSLPEIANLYTRLTIGDGLVSQIPAFLVAISAGLLVTRSNRKNDLPGDVVDQVFSRPQALLMTAAFLALLAFTELPRIPLLLLGAVCVAVAWFLDAEKKEQARKDAARQENDAAKERKQVRMGDLLILDSVELELGDALVSWADGELLDRIADVRAELARELGFLLPNVRVCDGKNLGGSEYRIRVNGSPVAEGGVRLGKWLAVEDVFITGTPQGLATKAPVHGTPAYWVAPEATEEAKEYGFRIFSPQDVLVEHLSESARKYAPELLSRDATQRLLDALAQRSPVVVRELIPDKMTVGEVQRVLQLLLAERVSIRSLGTILEALGEHISQTRNPVRLADFARQKLGRWIASRHLDPDGSLHVLSVPQEFEEKIRDGFDYTDDDLVTHLEPTDCDAFCKTLSVRYTACAMSGTPAVLLVSPQIRAAVRRLTEAVLPAMPVLSYTEVPRDLPIRSL
ncbi:MAG: flagellar biosynthesis protein FlhA [Planctomycetia bacterium]|nr:flagellar biosynthesis protein FlhA [Planctomycetia bacterium]